MAYRRRQQQQHRTSSTSTTAAATTPITPVSVIDPCSTYEDVVGGVGDDKFKYDVLATKAIRASSAAHSHRDSSLSSAYNPPPSPTPSSSSLSPHSSSKDPRQYTSTNTLNESKPGFWGSLARKAKSILDDVDNPAPHQVDIPGRRPSTHQAPPPSAAQPKHQQNSFSSRQSQRRTDAPPPFQKGLNAISSSLNYIGNAVEEGLNIVENRTADIIVETRKHIRRKPSQPQATDQTRAVAQPVQEKNSMKPQPQRESDHELQLKASRDVAMAMAAKAKLLLRELKTVKADLAFAKERCAQLEEENKILRENHERGETPENDDLIRLQLETLLAEKARLAHENSVYARENRFLREVVEYHQLTMQDVIYLDEGAEEVTEVYPTKLVSDAHSMSDASTPSSLHAGDSLEASLPATGDILPHPVPPPGLVEVSHSSHSPTVIALDRIKHSKSSI